MQTGPVVHPRRPRVPETPLRYAAHGDRMSAHRAIHKTLKSVSPHSGYGEGGSSSVRQGLDNEAESCPQDPLARFVSDIDDELAVISIRKTIAGHVGQSFDGLLRLFEAAKNKALAVRNIAVAVVGVKVEARHTIKRPSAPFIAPCRKSQRSRNYVSGS
jgi:hypothetical protein